MSVLFTRRGEPPVLGKALSDYAVGESVFLDVNGISTEFLVVNQGVPRGSTLYDASCNGTWLLMKNVFTTMAWYTDGSSYNNYESSLIHKYLNGEFIGLFNADVQNVIRQVKIPYWAGIGSNGNIKSGVDGLSTKAFLLSAYEVGWTSADQFSIPVDGAKLDYFISGNNGASLRIAYYNGSTRRWHLRSPYTTGHLNVVTNEKDGTLGTGAAASYNGVRPTVILPFDTKCDPDTNAVL